MAESDIDESVFEGLRDGKAKKGDTPPRIITPREYDILLSQASVSPSRSTV